MAQVFAPATTVIKDGEITINLVLTIKLEGSGLTASAPPETKPSSPAVPVKRVAEEDDDKVDFMIPDIKSEGLIQFGKKTT